MRQWEASYHRLADLMCTRLWKGSEVCVHLLSFAKMPSSRYVEGMLSFSFLFLVWQLCSYKCCCDSPKVDTVSSWWGWHESLQSPGSFGCAQLHLMGPLRWGSGFWCSDTVLTQHLQHMEVAQLSGQQEQAAAVRNIPAENFMKQDTIEMIRTVTGDWAMVFMPSSAQSKSNTAV